MAEEGTATFADQTFFFNTNEIENWVAGWVCGRQEREREWEIYDAGDGVRVSARACVCMWVEWDLWGFVI